MKHKWSDKQITALKESIEHWNELVSGDSFLAGNSECACSMDADDDCEVCPIY